MKNLGSSLYTDNKILLQKLSTAWNMPIEKIKMVTN